MSRFISLWLVDYAEPCFPDLSRFKCYQGEAFMTPQDVLRRGQGLKVSRDSGIASLLLERLSAGWVRKSVGKGAPIWIYPPEQPSCSNFIAWAIDIAAHTIGYCTARSALSQELSNLDCCRSQAVLSHEPFGDGVVATPSRN